MQLISVNVAHLISRVIGTTIFVQRNIVENNGKLTTKTNFKGEQVKGYLLIEFKLLRESERVSGFAIVKKTLCWVKFKSEKAFDSE